MNTGWSDINLVNDIVLRSLQEQHSSGKLRPNELDNTGVSLLHKAALDGQLTCLKWLVKYGGDPKIRSLEGSVAAHYAAGGGHLNILQYLYEVCKESISFKDNNDAAPLYIAAQEGQLDCLIWLTKTSAISPNDKTIDGMSPSHACAQEGKLDCLRYLIKNAHAHDKVTDNNGSTLLHYACSEGNNKISRWLIEHCSLTGNEQDKSGATALHIAAKGGHTSTIETLIKSNISVDIRDNHGKTALDYAIMQQQNKSANLLKDVMIISSMESKTQKKVRFNELVYTSDATIFKDTLSNHSNNKNKKRNLWDEEDMQAQFDSWLQPNHVKRKRNVKIKSKSLFKGKSKLLVSNNKNDSISQPKIEMEVVTETTKKLDSPDILKNIPSMPKGNTSLQLPKGLTTNNTDNENSSVTSDTTSNNSSIEPTFIKKTSQMTPLDKKKRKNIMKHSPPQVPKRNSGLNLTVVRQNSLLSLHERTNNKKEIITPKKDPVSKSVTYPDHFFARQESIKQPIQQPPNRPSSSLSNISLTRTQLSNTHRKNSQYIQKQDTMKYLPKSYFKNKQKTEYEVDGKVTMSNYRDDNNKYGFSIHRALPQARRSSQSSEVGFRNYIQDFSEFDNMNTSKRDKVDFFSNNMQSKVIGKGSTWSNIRRGVTSFFNTLRSKKGEQGEISTWGHIITHKPISPRDDIFSRFSINRKSEFDDLFNSSAEGHYTTHTEDNSFSSDKNQDFSGDKNRDITSLQRGYNSEDLSRLRKRALDSSLKGTNKYLLEDGTPIKSTSSLKTERQMNRYRQKPKGKVDAFIW